jgi:hypothetical protein
VNNLSDKVDIDPLDLLHYRTGCTSTSALIQAYRQLLVKNTGLRRYHLTKKTNKKSFLCGTCARTKITRKSFKTKEVIRHTTFLDKISCDISVYLNCASREGYKYILTFTDESTKMFWSYPMRERTADIVLQSLHDLYDTKLPHDAKIINFHSDGGKELITERVRTYLRQKGTRKFTNTPTDTPELNSVAERKFRTLGEMTLAMLSRSGLPKIW